MGLDAVGLLIEIEDEFCFEFDKNIWHHADTFGDVVDEVRRQLAQKMVKKQDGNGQTVLMELQTVLQELFPEQKSFSKEDKIARIIPYWKQSKYLTQLRQRFPELQWKKPRWMGFILLSALWLLIGVILFIPLCGILWIAGHFFQNQTILTLLPIIVYTLLWNVGILILTMLIESFLSPINTVGECATQIAEKRKQLHEWQQADENEIEEKLRKIFAKVLFVKPETIRRESTLDKDLNIG
ncbi:hypothetical protein FACS189454_02450 [Planctomycetales bacterium]|nr:hypothetical protein FACS189454_02450 [Planctomycetales bacterium]